MAKCDIPIHPQQVPQVMNVNGLSLRVDTLYCDAKGREKKRLRKQAEATLERLREPLQRLLGTDECILFVARGSRSLTALEQITAGWATYRYALFDLVLTNRRLLQFGVDPNGKWKKSLKSLAWGDVGSAKIKAGLLGKEFSLLLQNRSKLRYWRLGGPQANALRTIIPAVLAASIGEVTGHALRQLCPGCLRDLAPGQYQCSGCGMSFKDEQTLKRRAIIIPGGGYFYVNQTFMGVVAAIVDVYLLFLLAVALLDSRVVKSSEADNPIAQAVGVAVFVVFLISVEKTLEIYHARQAVRDFIPVEGAGAMRSAAGMS